MIVQQGQPEMRQNQVVLPSVGGGEKGQDEGAGEDVRAPSQVAEGGTRASCNNVRKPSLIQVPISTVADESSSAPFFCTVRTTSTEEKTGLTATALTARRPLFGIFWHMCQVPEQEPRVMKQSHLLRGVENAPKKTKMQLRLLSQVVDNEKLVSPATRWGHFCIFSPFSSRGGQNGPKKRSTSAKL